MATTKAAGEWHMVPRRRGSPANPQTTSSQPKPFQPFLTQPSYADMVRKTSPPPQAAPKLPPSSKHSSPSIPTTPAVYISPHSSSQLRFPPSPMYTEWKGRCFNCCRMGHNAARCRNPKRCGKCWGEGHVGSRCRQALNAGITPYVPIKPADQKKRGEPSFEDLLAEPIIAKPLPDNRPQKLVCFVDRDEEYFQELAKLNRAVVMYNSELTIDLTLEQVVQYAVSSNLVTSENISVGLLTKSRYVILLPHGLAPEKFIKAIPMEVWNEGFTFYQWSPLDDASVSVPHFKVLLDLVGIPLDLYREKEVVKATSSIGTYLGTIEQPRQGDLTRWTVAVATTDLARIPHQLAYMVGGLELPVEVIPRTWKHCPLYKPTEMVQPMKRYIPASSSSSDQNDGDLYPVSRAVLLELCRGRDMDSMSNGVKAALAGVNLMEITRNQIDEFLDNPEQVTQMATQDRATANLNDDTDGHFESPVLGLTHREDVVGHVDPLGNSLGRFQASATPQTIMLRNIVTPTRILKSQLVCPLSTDGQRSDVDNSEMEASHNTPRSQERGKDKILEGDSCQGTGRFPLNSVPYLSPRDRHPANQKRKKNERAQRRRAKEDHGRPKSAVLKKNADGLVEVQVTYEHCSRIAAGSGFQTAQVQQAVQQDNTERAETLIAARAMTQDSNLDLNGDTEFNQGEHLTDFDADSDDELGSDFE